jgi:hypothetical protein
MKEGNAPGDTGPHSHQKPGWRRWPFLESCRHHEVEARDLGTRSSGSPPRLLDRPPLPMCNSPGKL